LVKASTWWAMGLLLLVQRPSPGSRHCHAFVRLQLLISRFLRDGALTFFLPFPPGTPLGGNEARSEILAWRRVRLY
jgi:hypothetical protein